MNVSEEVFQDWLEGLFFDLVVSHCSDDYEFDAIDYDEDGNGIYPENSRSFDSVMLLTDNKGVVVTLSDGSEFQLTIVKSK